MEGTNCGGEGGWTRVAYVDMTQTGATCPMELYPENYNNKFYCGNHNTYGCSKAVFPTLVQYSRVCGRVRGYQYGETRAFSNYGVDTSLTIDGNYVDGVSITYAVLHANTSGHMQLE